MTEFQPATAELLAEAEHLFAEALARCVPRLEALAAGPPPLPHLNEARHLAPTFRRELAEAACRGPHQPDVSPALGVAALKPLWPRLGPFDASLRFDTQTVYCELKCGPDEVTLEACAWDALKCAFALRHGFGVGMVLIAGAPTTLWDRSARGCELFADREWDAADLRDRYRQGFATWESDGYRPLRVPDRLRTIAGPRFAVDVGGAPWMLALARVESVGDGWLDWSAPLDGAGAG